MSWRFASASNQSISMADVMHITGAFTVAAWVNVDDTLDERTIISKYSTTGSQRSWLVQVDDGGDIRNVYSSSGVDNDADITANVITGSGQWNHVCVGIDGAGNRYTWINGGTADVDTTAFSTIYDSSAPIRIGAWESTAEDMNGLVAEVSVFLGLLPEPVVFSLAKGYSAAFFKNMGLGLYAPLIREPRDLVSGGVFTIERGSPAADPDHPRIYYPDDGYIPNYVTAAASGGLLPMMNHHGLHTGVSA